MKTPTKSFRIRLAVSTALLAGLALVGFAALAWWQVRDSRIGAFDRQIRDQAERELSRRWSADHWAGHERNMNRAFGAQALEQSLLFVQDRNGVIFRSEHWPQGLNPDTLPWPKAEYQAEGRGLGNAVDEKLPAGDPRPPDIGYPAREGTRQPFPRPPGDGPERPAPSPADRVDGFAPNANPPPRPPLPAFSVASFDSGSRNWHFGLAAMPSGERLAIGVDLVLVEAEMADLRNAFVLATPLALGFIGLGAWLLSGHALSPIKQLTATMESVTAKGLDQRVKPGKEDQEFRQLIRVFNDMLERLERSFLQASRFSADAAHELKTPLAILQGQIEQAIAQSEAGSPSQARLTEILDEVQRLSTISRKLLLLSLADAGRLRLNITRFDLTQTLEDLVEDAQMLAPELVVSGSVASGLTVAADAALLRQVLHNLLGNAVKYNLPDGWIRIAASRVGERIEVSVASASNGIPATDRERIFERFYRADPAHHRQVEGVGLGLSLSREIARAHGGDLVLGEAKPGEVGFVLNLAA